MPISFPSSPALGDNYSYNGKTWIWSGSAWKLNASTAGATVAVNTTAPSNPSAGNLWVDSDSGDISAYIGGGWAAVSLAANTLPDVTSNSGKYLSTDGYFLNWSSVTIPDAVSKITGVTITNSSYVALDDTAIDTAGGYIKLTGTGFTSGCQVVVGTTPATSTTYISSTEVRAQIAAASAGTYIVYLVNADGGTAIRVNGLTFSSSPVWSTTSPLSNGASGSPISIQLGATSNSTITYSLASGSSLPSGLALNSGGLLSGTVSGLSVDTLYSFTVTATDAELQDNPRTFNITITVRDAYFPYVALLLNTTSTNGQQNNTFLDSSTNNFTITRNGTPTQGSFTPYQPNGYWSGYFNGSNQYLTSATGIINFSAGQAYTVECWFYTPISSATNQCILTGGADTFSFGINSSTGAVFIGKSNVVDFISTTGSFQPNAWYHVAVARNTSNQTRCWVNGTSVGSSSSDTYAYNDVAPYIGANYNPGGYFNGYLSNLRVVKGTAVYDPTQTNITIPTGPLSAVTNTTLLTLQNNRFIDNSGNSKTVTPVNSTAIQAFQPFSPAASYSAATYGGSGYFAGGSNNLGLSTQAALPTGTQQFTVEFWAYKLDAWSTSTQHILNDDASSGFQIWVNTGGSILRLGRASVAGVLDYNYSNLQINTWTHFAYSRKGNDFALWVNGSRVATVTDTNGFASTNGTQTIGGYTSNGWNGYLSNIRVVKGSYVYDTASTSITVPTTPVTAITNTSLLTNFGNAGIYDAAWQNYVTTVGDAQVSTTQKQWGTTSMKFDGTGDYMTVPSSVSWNLPGDFTVETWIYLNVAGTDYSIVGKWGASNYNYAWILQYMGATGPYIRFLPGNSGLLFPPITFSTTLLASTWYYLAVSRSGSSVRCFVNGTQIGSTATNSNNLTSASGICAIGYNPDSGGVQYFNGYIQDLRITNGYARYLSNFTTPTAAFAGR